MNFRILLLCFCFSSGLCWGSADPHELSTFLQRSRSSQQSESSSQAAARGEINVLVVIDMQYAFYSSRNIRLREQIAMQIREAIQRGDYIAFVEYVLDPSEGISFGSTYEELIDLVRGYERVLFIEKSKDSGGVSLALALYLQDLIPVDRILVCGVNTQACVRSTIIDLLNLSRFIGPLRVYLLEDCCAAHTREVHREGLELLQEDFRDEQNPTLANRFHILRGQGVLNSRSMASLNQAQRHRDYWINRPTEEIQQDLWERFESETIRVLVISNMQESHNLAWDQNLVQRILLELDNAINQEDLIVFLEVQTPQFWNIDYGETIKALLSAVEGYDLFFRIAHTTDSAARNLRALFAELGHPYVQELRLAGLYTWGTIGQTVLDFMREDMEEIGEVYSIVLLEDLCADPVPEKHRETLNRISGYAIRASGHLGPVANIGCAQNADGSSFRTSRSHMDPYRNTLVSMMHAANMQGIRDFMTQRYQDFVQNQHPNLYYQTRDFRTGAFFLSRYYMHRGDAEGIEWLWSHLMHIPSSRPAQTLRAFLDRVGVLFSFF